MESQIEMACRKIDKAMAEMFELEPSLLKPSAHLFTDLGLDSLDAIDLVMKFQTEFGVTLASEEMQAIRTMQDVYNLVERKVTVQ